MSPESSGSDKIPELGSSDDPQRGTKVQLCHNIIQADHDDM
jgi:hypothetical protein